MIFWRVPGAPSPTLPSPDEQPSILLGAQQFANDAGAPSTTSRASATFAVQPGHDRFDTQVAPVQLEDVPDRAGFPRLDLDTFTEQRRVAVDVELPGRVRDRDCPITERRRAESQTLGRAGRQAHAESLIALHRKYNPSTRP